MASSMTGRLEGAAPLLIGALVATAGGSRAGAEEHTSYAPVASTESFDATLERMNDQRKAVMGRQNKLLGERYDLGNRSARGVTRRSEKPSRGVTCFDCHANAATHLVGDIRPQKLRHRVDTPSLRGANVQRLFGSQRALKTVEDFTVLGRLDPSTATEAELRHDERLRPLEDTVEFFNLVLGTQLAAQEKAGLTAFMRAL